MVRAIDSGVVDADGDFTTLLHTLLDRHANQHIISQSISKRIDRDEYAHRKPTGRAGQ
jgi:hypothetical protein